MIRFFLNVHFFRFFLYNQYYRNICFGLKSINNLLCKIISTNTQTHTHIYISICSKILCKKTIR